MQISEQIPIEQLAQRKVEKGLLSEIAEKYAESIVKKTEGADESNQRQLWLMYSRPYMKK